MAVSTWALKQARTGVGVGPGVTEVKGDRLINVLFLFFVSLFVGIRLLLSFASFKLLLEPVYR
jgi:hypothetical protein